MKFSMHLICSLVLAAIAYPFFGLPSILIIAGGVLIDFDHYMHFIVFKKKLNPFECNSYYTNIANQKDFMGILLVFHNIEFLAIIVILSFFSRYALIFTLGVISHYILDFIWFKFFLKRFVLTHSIFLWVYRNKFKKFK